MLLAQIEKTYATQPYLSLLYRTLFITAYFGLFRACEITSTKSTHAVKARDVQIGFNKKKIMFILRSSKTHGKGSKPQIIKISSKDCKTRKNNKLTLPCPYELLREFSVTRIPFATQDDQFFVFRDGTAVTDYHMRVCLKNALIGAGFNHRLYSLQSFRSGRTGDLLKLGVPIETIKKIGRWKSNAVFKYLKYF